MFKSRVERIALYGGSFDPPHFGHKRVAEEAIKVLDIDKLLLIPTFLNPFKSSSFLIANERLERSKNFFNFSPKILVSDFEVEQNRVVPTVETLKHFKQCYDVCYIIVGAENLENIERWKEFAYLNAQIIWVIATRKGYALQTNKLRDFKILEVNVELSSTQIRNNMTKESK